MNTPALRRIAFILLLVGVTVAFLWVLAPLFGAVMWAVTLALLFHPINQAILRRVRGRATLASLLTLSICLVIVILPMILIASSLVTDITAFLQKVRGGQINLGSYVQQTLAAVPSWVTEWLARFELFDLQSVLDKLSSSLLQGGQLVATHALAVGQNTFEFLVNFAVMLYLLFFLLRDGVTLSQQVRAVLPLERRHTRFLLDKFATVVRATVKGNVVVALVQGALGALAFWVLGVGGAVFWGVVMALLSLLPAIGAVLVWGPVAVYLLATGALWQGVALVVWGALVIGMTDNVLRPVLVGKDTKLPDWLVLASTIGGMSLFGINGFVIGPTIAAMFIACWAVFGRADSALAEDGAL